MLERDSSWGIRDSLGHPIPESELDKRAQEIEDVLELLKGHPIVIITAEENSSGKSTFARILRYKILSEPEDTPFTDCIFIGLNRLHMDWHESRRQDRYATYDDFSYPDLIRFDGLIIVDEVYPDYLQLTLTLKRARLLLIVQPDFLEGPPYDDEIHEEFVVWLKENDIPIYNLTQYKEKTRAAGSSV